MGMNLYVWGIRNAMPDEIKAMKADLAGEKEFEDWSGKNNIYPDVDSECIRLGAVKHWNGKNVRVGLPRNVMSGDADYGTCEIDLMALKRFDSRITKIIIQKDF